jgi:hypothetical protein
VIDGKFPPRPKEPKPELRKDEGGVNADDQTLEVLTVVEAKGLTLIDPAVLVLEVELKEVAVNISTSTESYALPLTPLQYISNVPGRVIFLTT